MNFENNFNIRRDSYATLLYVAKKGLDVDIITDNSLFDNVDDLFRCVLSLYIVYFVADRMSFSNTLTSL